MLVSVEMSELMSEEALLKALDADVKKEGGVQPWCRKHRLSESLLSQSLDRYTSIAPQIARVMGYTRVIMYRKEPL